MPKYDYQCSECGFCEEFTYSFELKPSFVKCYECGANMKQVFAATPAHFKGTGWGKDA
jgi:putative FmdB family regulatory protein